MSLQQEIFEKSDLDTEYDKILDDSDNEEQEDIVPEIKPLIKKKTIKDDIDEPIVKVDKRKGKRSKPISEEHRAILLDNLARGRAKALETRRKNAQLKKIERDEKISEKEERLLSALNKKKDKSRNNDDLLKKIADLENKLKEKEAPPPKVSKPLPKPAPPAPKPAPKEAPAKQKEVSKPLPQEAPPKNEKVEVQLSKKELLKLMKNVRR